MAPESAAPWAPKVLQRRGALFPGSAPGAVPVLCVAVGGTTLWLAPLPGARPTPTPCRSRLRFVDASGVLELRGLLTSEGPAAAAGSTPPTLRFAADPTSATLVNHREAYRVGVTLKGELALCAGNTLAPPAAGWRGAPTEQSLRAPPRPCLVLDLSLGGARVALPSPAPHAGQPALLSLALTRGEVLRQIAVTVVQGRERGGHAEFGALARLRFAPLAGPAEARLSRLINQVQLQTLRRGVRDRRLGG